VLAVLLMVQVAGVLGRSPDTAMPTLDLQAGAAALAPSAPELAGKLKTGSYPDVHLVGQNLFTGHNLQLQIIGTLLLVATVGVVVLSRRGGEGERGASRK
jgi:NADH-quinone oxidoreductase subunit J